MMCTAISVSKNEHYFGRNLDLDRSYGEVVCVMPRRYPLNFRKQESITEHYAMIGMATVVDNIPLFYDAANEYGLAMAGLNFPDNAYYPEFIEGKDNVAPFELIPWILGQCKTISEAKVFLEKINLVNIPFSGTLPLSPLHWIIADSNDSIVVETRRDGVYVLDNPVGVLTNNPPFEYQIENLQKYSHLRTDNKNVVHEEGLEYSSYCQGLGAVGLPGDASSMSRFVRAVFGLRSSVCETDELSCVGQVFHLLTSVEMMKGTCVTDENTLDFTGYSACINTTHGIYYYVTYDNRRISCVDMHKEDLNADKVSLFPLALKQDISCQN